MTQVGIYLTNSEATAPTMGTQQAACYDVYACLTEDTRVQVINEFNESQHRTAKEGLFTLFGGERALIPTGCIFDIPEGYSLRLHPRSGISFKHGVSLVNAEGIIDSDYYHETMVALINHADSSFVIKHGDRIAQMELTKVNSISLVSLQQPPGVKTDRSGGFGSTGIDK